MQKKSPNPTFNYAKKSIINVFNTRYNAHTDPLFKKLGTLQLFDQFTFNRAVHMHKYRYERLPISFQNKYSFKSESGNARLRNEDGNFNIPSHCKTLLIPHIESAKAWNQVPYHIKNITSEKILKTYLKEFFIAKYKAFSSPVS